jgi:hypothetical protein
MERKTSVSIEVMSIEVSNQHTNNFVRICFHAKHVCRIVYITSSLIGFSIATNVAKVYKALNKNMNINSKYKKVRSY